MIETSFYELRMKSVINVVDGRNLGNICDVVMEVCSGKVLGFVVPGKKKWYNCFKSCEDIFIPYHNICKIGVDSILVELTCTETKNFQTTSFSEVSCSDSVECNKCDINKPQTCPNMHYCNNKIDNKKKKHSDKSCESFCECGNCNIKNYVND